MAFPICFPWLNTSNLRGLAHSWDEIGS
jgi:hypothetical protein